MERIDKRTPHGGEYAIVYFLDNNNNTCDKENATNGYIQEFDSQGKMIYETRFIKKDKFVYNNKNTLNIGYNISKVIRSA